MRSSVRRQRQPESPQRAPLVERLSRADKRVAGRTLAGETPAFIRSVGVILDGEERDYVRRKLGRKLGKFARAIERVSVRVQDVNGARGGIDKQCRIKVVLSGLPSVVVEERHHALRAALDGALSRIQGAVRSATLRRRMKPRQRSGPQAGSHKPALRPVRARPRPHQKAFGRLTRAVSGLPIRAPASENRG